MNYEIGYKLVTDTTAITPRYYTTTTDLSSLINDVPIPPFPLEKCLEIKCRFCKSLVGEAHLHKKSQKIVAFCSLSCLEELLELTNIEDIEETS